MKKQLAINALSLYICIYANIGIRVKFIREAGSSTAEEIIVLGNSDQEKMVFIFFLPINSFVSQWIK